jgi:hypothetical protein
LKDYRQGLNNSAQKGEGFFKQALPSVIEGLPKGNTLPTKHVGTYYSALFICVPLTSTFSSCERQTQVNSKVNIGRRN